MRQEPSPWLEGPPQRARHRGPPFSPSLAAPTTTLSFSLKLPSFRAIKPPMDAELAGEYERRVGLALRDVWVPQLP
jgi:hypothetical protein